MRLEALVSDVLDLASRAMECGGAAAAEKALEACRSELRQTIIRATESPALAPSPQSVAATSSKPIGVLSPGRAHTTEQVPGAPPAVEQHLLYCARHWPA